MCKNDSYNCDLCKACNDIMVILWIGSVNKQLKTYCTLQYTQNYCDTNKKYSLE